MRELIVNILFFLAIVTYLTIVKSVIGEYWMVVYYLAGITSLAILMLSRAWRDELPPLKHNVRQYIGGLSICLILGPFSLLLVIGSLILEKLLKVKRGTNENE